MIASTGVARYRHLCLEHPDPAVRAGYRRLIRQLATGGYPAAGDTSWLPGPCGGCR